MLKNDGSPMMCCSVCSKWQHISCHDGADLRAGRPQRNWDVEDFVCRRCTGIVSQTSNRILKLRNPSMHLSPAHSVRSPRSQGPNLVQMSPFSGDFTCSSYTQAPNRNHFETQDYASKTYSAVTFTHYHPRQDVYSSLPYINRQNFDSPYLPYSVATQDRMQVCSNVSFSLRAC